MLSHFTAGIVEYRPFYLCKICNNYTGNYIINFTIEDQGSGESSLPDHCLQFSVKLRVVLASIDSEYLWFGPYNDEEDYDLDLFEGYIFWSTNSIDLTVGKQIIRWGKTDQINPADNVNPHDLRKFIVPDYENPQFLHNSISSDP